MKDIGKVALGVVTGIGGFLDAGTIATCAQAGALFGNLSLGPEGHGAILGLIVLVAAVTAGMARLTVQRTLRSME